jgi:multiple sugar transport system permease protein
MNKIREQLAAYLFISPSFVFFTVFVLVPAVMGLGLSFFNWDLGASTFEFAGLDNWKLLFDNREAWLSIKNTLLLVAISLPLSLAIGLGLALMVNKLPFGKMLFRSIFFAPVVTSLVAMSIIWRTMYASDTGIINYGLQLLGLPAVEWLSEPIGALFAVVILTLWHSSGYNMLIILAGLQGVDESLYEAATVDGSNKWSMFWKITLPLLSPTLFFITVTSVIGGLQSFEAVYLLTGGGPGYATTTLVYFIWNSAFNSMDMGLAATISIVLFLLIFIVTLIQWKFQRKWVHYN